MTQVFRKGIQYYIILILIELERIFAQYKWAAMTRQLFLHLNLTQLILKFLHTGFSSFKMYVCKVQTFICIKPSLVLKSKVTGFLQCGQQSILV